MEQFIIEVSNVSFGYNGQTVLKDVNLKIGRGDFIAMIGPNGGGKTTLLKLILGLLRPSHGTIRVMGRPASQSSGQIGYVPQNIHMNRKFPITVMDVVLMGLMNPHHRRRRFGSKDRQRAIRALERMEVANLADRKIGLLSGGQRQRVFIARALVSEPSLILMDEPAANIDTKGQADLFKMLNELNQTVTILVVSHDLMVISRYAKSVACVNRNVHYHHQAEITGDMLEIMYPCTAEEVCPVELIAHGLPHRVLQEH